MNVPFLDLKAQYKEIKQEIDFAVASVIESSSFIKGAYVEEFEHNFAFFCKAKFCLGVGNGTDALFIALKSCNIDEEDEVIVPSNSFIATSESVTMAGAKVIFVDCNPKTYNIDVSKIEERITSRTKAIVVVHLYGQPANLPEIKRIAEKYSLLVIQDCAQAHGARIYSKSLIKFGDILCFSFYPGKNLGAFGDAGAIVCNDKDIFNRAKMFANHGRISKYDHKFEGVNSRLDGIQAAVLNVKLKHLPKWTKKRQEIADYYNCNISKSNFFIKPFSKAGYEHVYHLYVIRSLKRDLLKCFLDNAGVQTGIHYPVALPFLKAYKHLNYQPVDLPVSYKYQSQLLSLPIYPELNMDKLRYTVQLINSFNQRYHEC